MQRHEDEVEVKKATEINVQSQTKHTEFYASSNLFVNTVALIVAMLFVVSLGINWTTVFSVWKASALNAWTMIKHFDYEAPLQQAIRWFPTTLAPTLWGTLLTIILQCKKVMFLLFPELLPQWSEEQDLEITLELSRQQKKHRQEVTKLQRELNNFKRNGHSPSFKDNGFRGVRLPNSYDKFLMFRCKQH